MVHRRTTSFINVQSVLVTCCCLGFGFVSDTAEAQPYDSWSKVEAAEETRDYGLQIRDGKFDAAQEAFVKGIVLPQLALPANRGSIVQVRQRIREVITRGATAPKIFDSANRLARDFMVGLAQDAAAEPILRVNAVLLLGDLQSADRKPWRDSLEPLARMAADDSLPLAVRIAAVVSLSRHQADATATEPFSKIAGPALVTIITNPPEGDSHGVSWIIGRALELLPPPAAGPEVIKAAAGILAADGADLDLRIRAASALGRSSLPPGTIDQPAMIGHVRSLAVTALNRDLAAAEARRFSRLIGGGQGPLGAPMMAGEAASRPPSGQFGGEGLFGGLSGEEGASAGLHEDGIPPLACRRDAWRLSTLADAVKPDGAATGGLAAGLKGDAAAEAIDLASALREQARGIHQSPTEKSIKAAAEALANNDPKPAPTSGQPAGETADSESPPAVPAQPSAF